MVKRFSLAVSVMVAVLLACGPLSADESQGRQAINLLFGESHLAKLDKGQQIFFNFKRETYGQAGVGPTYDDIVRFSVIGENEKTGEKTLTLQMYTGDRAVTPRDLRDQALNPYLIIFLDRCVNNFAQLAGGSRPYLKNRFQVAFRTLPKVTEEKFSFAGETVEGYRIEIQPFIEDAHKDKMKGYEKSKFTFLLSSKVPGYFLELKADYSSTEKDQPRITEIIRFDKSETVPEKKN